MDNARMRKANYIRLLISKAEIRKENLTLTEDTMQRYKPYSSLLMTLTRMRINEEEHRIEDLKLQLIDYDEAFDPANEPAVVNTDDETIEF